MDDRVSATDELADVSRQLGRVGLDDVLATAELQTRSDRKYVVPAPVLTTVLHRLGSGLSVLEIDGRRLFRYESTYFDTPELTTYRQHVHGRRRRVKIRTRAYLDSGECLLEFKHVGGRGETVKERHPYMFATRHQLDESALVLAEEVVGHLVSPPALRRVLTTAYLRMTLLHGVSGSRLTCDADLSFLGCDERAFGPLAGLVVVESKTAGPPSPVDHALHDAGVRPVALSKYCAGMAVLDPTLPANRWNRELRTYFGWSPRRTVAPDECLRPQPNRSCT